MSAKTAKVISLTTARALRDTLDSLHNPTTKEIIYDGALAEFKRLVSPVIRRLLEAKNSPESVQNELINLLEHIYSNYHVDQTVRKHLK